MSPLTYKEAWDRIGGANPICDACGDRVLGEAGVGSSDSRPYQFSELAQSGIFHVLCEDCACPSPKKSPYEPIGWGRRRFFNFVEACVARASVPQGGDSSMGDTVELTRPHDPDAAAKAAAEDDARQKEAQAAEDAKLSAPPAPPAPQQQTGNDNDPPPAVNTTPPAQE